MEVTEVIIDANVLIECVKRKFNVSDKIKEAFPKARVIISRPIFLELESISRGKGKSALYARVALDTVKKNKIEIAKTENTGDDSMLELCNKNTVLVTYDKELKEACKKLGFNTGFIGKGNYLMLD